MEHDPENAENPKPIEMMQIWSCADHLPRF